MTEDDQQQAQAQPRQLDPAFYDSVNEYLEVTNRQSKAQGLKRTSMAGLYAASRFNAFAYMATAGEKVAVERKGFLDYMTHLYRRMLNEHLDSLGAERGVDVGESELACDQFPRFAGDEQIQQRQVAAQVAAGIDVWPMLFFAPQPFHRVGKLGAAEVGVMGISLGPIEPSVIAHIL